MEERIVDVICGQNEKRNCAIKLDGVSCDGYNEHMTLGVFSHFHEDHIGAITTCIGKYDRLIVHPVTFAGINALKPGMRLRQQWIPQDYDSKYRFSNGVIRLLKANHIPGSSQVHVETGGNTLLYSGDFSYPDVQIREAEHLVIDSTHGDPSMDGKTDRISVKNRMLEYISERLDLHPALIVQASTGTIQEIVRHFEMCAGMKLSDDVAFVMEKKQKNVLHNIYVPDKDQFRYIEEYDSPKFWSIIRNKKKCVMFTTQTKIYDDDLSGYHKVMVDRYRFESEKAPIQEFDGGCRFNLAAHASIDGIYDYIEEVNPKHVVTDNSRSQFAKQLSKMIRQKFPKITTEYRPAHVSHDSA